MSRTSCGTVSSYMHIQKTAIYLRRNYPTTHSPKLPNNSAPPRRTQLGVVVYGVLLLNSKHAEEHGMFLNKHYVVPFVKECAVLFNQYKVKNKTP